MDAVIQQDVGKNITLKLLVVHILNRPVNPSASYAHSMILSVSLVGHALIMMVVP
jgi:uncharacterized membrane protein YhhN